MTCGDSAAARVRPPTAWYALGLVLGYVLAQFLGGILAGTVYGFAAAWHRGPTAAGSKPDLPMLAWSVLVGLLLAGAWAVFFAQCYARGVLREPGPRGVAWRRAGLRAYAVAVLLTVLLLLLAILVEQLHPPDLPRLTGPAELLARAQGLPYALFLVCVVFVAPPLEEFVFRGVAFAAVARSFGTVAAVLLTTLAFALLHYADKIHYWPGFVLVAALGLIACGLRLHFKSLWPGILMHCGYNALVLFLH